MFQNIFSPEQTDLLKQFSSNLNHQQLLWLAGYYAGLSERNTDVVALTETDVALQTVVTTTEITILYGSRTGNGEGLAKIAQKIATEQGYKATLKNMGEYKTRDLQNEKNLLVIVSTHGEGEPPFAAKELYEFIFGKRAPKLEGVNFAVLGLGDSSYFHFCKTGIDFDNQLEKLGAKRIHTRITLDVDFAETAEKHLLDALKAFGGSADIKPIANAKFSMVAGVKKTDVAPTVSKSNPYKAPVLDKVGLHGRGSDRQTIHIELSTDNNAALNYQPGDAAGIVPVNTQELINETLATTGLDAGQLVSINKKEIKLEEALYKNLELSKITVDVVKRYLETYPNDALAALTTNADKFKTYLDGRDIVDLFTDYPAQLSAENLVKILRPLQPRYYSISSSPKAFPGEVHLTVGVVQYHHAGRDKKGACSNYLSDVLIDNETVPVFIEPNPGFRLPANDQTPIIMVGAGTGIAPYRAFVQHRELAENPGKSWLFFGNRNFESEFLYQTEWQDFLKTGALTKLDVAFSRDGDTKIYVQDKLWENGAEVFQWLEQGAHFYICGDMKNMARAVQDNLLKIVEKYGLRSTQDAQEYVDQLEKTKRLQLDVY